LETIQCIFCPSTDISDPVVIRENGWEGRQCSQCRLIYISPRPSPAEIATLYADDSAHTGLDNLARNELHRRLCARHSLRILRNYAQSGRLLEIGAGAGFFLDEARRAGYSVAGIDLNKVQANKMALNGIECDTRPLADAFPGEVFDIIYHCDVTSHFYDPITEFSIMSRRLKPGGILMFETGNFGDIGRKWYRRIPSFQYPDHLFFLSAGNLPTLLSRSGFQHLRTYGFSRGLEMRLTRQSHAHAPVNGQPKRASSSEVSTTHKVKSIVRYLLTHELGRVIRWASSPQTMIVIARKSTVAN
jgi:SAM-dependent methyltransferase